MQCRSRVVLLLSYLLSLVAVVASVALLLHEKRKAEDADLWIGAVRLVPCCCCLQLHYLG